MGKITGGEFRYLRRIKTGDYEHKEVDVKMSWSADEGDSVPEAISMANRAEDQVIARVGQMLAAPLHAPLKAGGTDRGVVSAPVEPAAAETAGPQPPAPAQPRTRGRPPGSPNKPRGVEEKPADPLAMPGESSVETAPPQATAQVGTDASVSDPAAIDLMEAEEVVTITDLVLQDKITRKNGSMIEKGVTEAPRRIKKLIAIYAGGPAPKTARDIPADKRAAFLLELDKAETVVLP